MVSSDGMVGSDVLQIWVILIDIPAVPCRLGEVSSFWRVWGYDWEDCFGAFCLGGPEEKGVTGVEENFGDVASDDFLRVLSSEERYCERIKFFLK